MRRGRPRYQSGVTDPQLARAALSEVDAQRRDVDTRVAKLPISAVLRAHTTGETQGFMKALVGRSHDRILGFTMIGPEAGEVLATVQTAMLAELPYPTLRDAVLAHPTMTEGLGPLLIACTASRGLMRRPSLIRALMSPFMIWLIGGATGLLAVQRRHKESPGLQLE
jgi:hypothetical protein